MAKKSFNSSKYNGASLFDQTSIAINTLVKVHIGNWYLNAGIIGFLRVLCDGDFEKLDSFSKKLIIGENFIEFDISILDGFEEKFYKQLFLNYFNKNQYLAYINKALQQKKRDGSFDIKKAKEEINKFPFKGLWETLDYSLNSEDEFLNYKSYIESLTSEGIYELVAKDEFLNYFIKGVTKGIIGLSNIKEYTESSKNKKYILKHKDRVCISCQVRKAEFEVSNAISNIIGFNKDNSNWIWGFDSKKVQFCSICALIYLSASVGLIFTKRGRDYLNCFYFINHNGNIKSLINSYIQFKHKISETKEQKSIYPIMVKEAIKFTKATQAEKTIKNISFIEIIENGMGGQGTKGYNIYSFSLSQRLAEFLDNHIQWIPVGYYKIDKEYFDLEEEFLRLSIERKLGYKDIDRLLRIYIKGNETNRKFSSKKVVDYALNYINHQKGDERMDLEKISKKGFINGKELGGLLRNSDKENQIKGLVYQFLNDLKVADRDRFLDKYLRITISNGLESRFGFDELNSKDAFLHFGYSFISGLLNIHINTKEKQGEENE